MVVEQRASLVAVAADGDVDRLRAKLATSSEPISAETVQSLLTAAAQNCNLEVLTFLLDSFPSAPLEEEVIRAAVNTGSVPIFKALLYKDPSVINAEFDRRGSPLIVACMGRQSIDYLRFLLEAGADPNQDPDAAAYPLPLVAALYADTAAIDLLLQHSARLERSGTLAAAAQRGNEAMARHLLEKGARPSSDATALAANSSPLHVAVRAGHVGVARLLLQRGADANSADASGATAIAIAREMEMKGQDMSEMLMILTC